VFGNPGPGGWAAILRYNGQEKEIWGCAAHTTNNRMELTAAIEALRTLKESCEAEVVTDSEYLKNGITTWIHGWKKKGWLTASKKPVINKESSGWSSTNRWRGTRLTGSGPKATPPTPITIAATNWQRAPHASRSAARRQF